jgi:hypothetical protein
MVYGYFFVTAPIVIPRHFVFPGDRFLFFILIPVERGICPAGRYESKEEKCLHGNSGTLFLSR